MLRKDFRKLEIEQAENGFVIKHGELCSEISIVSSAIELESFISDYYKEY